MKGINQPQNYASFINFRMFLFRLLSTCPFSNNPQKYQKKKKSKIFPPRNRNFSLCTYTAHMFKRWIGGQLGGKIILNTLFTCLFFVIQLLHPKSYTGKSIRAGTLIILFTTESSKPHTVSSTQETLKTQARCSNSSTWIPYDSFFHLGVQQLAQDTAQY